MCVLACVRTYVRACVCACMIVFARMNPCVRVCFSLHRADACFSFDRAACFAFLKKLFSYFIPVTKSLSLQLRLGILAERIFLRISLKRLNPIEMGEETVSCTTYCVPLVLAGLCACLARICPKLPWKSAIESFRSSHFQLTEIRTSWTWCVCSSLWSCSLPPLPCRVRHDAFVCP